MYETAAMMKEMRAECPEWTRSRCRTASASKPAARKASVPVAQKSATASNSSKIKLPSFRETMAKAEKAIVWNKQRLAKLDDEIRKMGMAGAGSHIPMMVQKQNDRKEVLRKIRLMEMIRDDCKKQLGMK